MSGGLGGGRPPKPPGGGPRPGIPEPAKRSEAGGPATPRTAKTVGRPAHIPAGVRVDRQALQRMIDGRGQGRSGDESSESEALDRIGDDRLDIETLQKLSSSLVAEHLMILLATKRKDNPRSEVLAEVGDLLARFTDPQKIMSVFNRMPVSGGIVDIYPLEVCTYVLEHRKSGDLPIRFAPFIKNRDKLEGQSWPVETPVSIAVPVALKMRQFALEGGGSPGYFFAPGGPGEYRLEFGDPGRYVLLMRGDVRKKACIERLTLQVR